LISPRNRQAISECIRAGLSYLASEQAPNGAFRVVVMVGGPGVPSGALASPFVTAMVLDTLHVLGERFEAKRLARPAVAYLLSETAPGGPWGASGRHADLPDDLDSSA